MAASFLFYDLETFGADPRRSRIAQFAAVRTTPALDVMEEPLSFFVQPADDLLPSPIATLITGITPQRALHEGVNEAEAFARVRTAAKLTRYGHDCYAYAMIAAGHIDGVLESKLKPFDIAALIPIITGAGETRPVASNDSEAGRAENRRVEMTLVPLREG